MLVLYNSCQSLFRDIMSMKLNWLCLIFSMFFISFRVISRPLHQERELNGILRWQPDLFITLLWTWEVSKDIFNLLGFCWEQTHHREFQGWNVVRVYKYNQIRGGGDVPTYAWHGKRGQGGLLNKLRMIVMIHLW